MVVSRVIRFLRAEDGPTAVEYAVMLALVLMAVIASVSAVGNSTSGLWSSNNNKIATATGGS